MKPSNCLFYALWRCMRRGGYIVIRKSHWGWWPHFFYTGDLIHFEEFSPIVPNEEKRFPPLLFRGYVLHTSAESQMTRNAEAAARRAAKKRAA